MIEKEQGNDAIISCNAPDSFPHRTIQWTKRTTGGKQQLAPSSHRTVSQEGDLHFAFLDSSDTGDYICTVNNLFIMKNVARTVTLNVLPGKYIT